MKNILFLAIAVVRLCLLASSQNAGPILGVLEDTPGHYAGDLHYFSVRVVFARRGADWIAFPSDCPDQDCLRTVVKSYPEKATWTVSFDGRKIGALTTERPNEFDFYSIIGQQRIISKTPIPTIGKPSQSFGGFLGQPVNRPLIANSQPFFTDPERWKPAQLSPRLVSGVRQAFRAKFPSVKNCANPEDSKAVPWRYADENIHILSAYTSLKRWSVIRLELEPYNCDGPSDESFIDQWFVVAPDSSIRSLGRAMWLVDAGDYDNDGRSELVFSIDDYNRGGYRLFYDDLNKSATFEFGYH